MSARGRLRRRVAGPRLGGLALLVLAGCSEVGPRTDPAVPLLYGGDPAAGARLISLYGCGSCHRIPGIPEADALVGPPLEQWAHRAYVAGNRPNTPPNLVAWLLDPQAIEPGTAMPDVGLTEVQAMHVAAYLYTLR